MSATESEEVEDPPDPDVEGEEEPDGEEEEGVEMVKTDVAESGVDPEGVFDGIEEGASASSDDIAESIFDGEEDAEEDSDDDSPEAASTRSSGVAGDINNGAARLAVVGLPDEWEDANGEEQTKDGLQTEFEEVFEAFRLGHYGSEVVEEYLLVETDDIHPVWGLVGAMLICAAVVIYRRPDGDQVVDSTKNRLGQFDLSNIKPERN